MKFQHIIGADLSKKSIDLFCHLLSSHIKIENSVIGFKEFFKWLKHQKIDPAEILIVMEHTGLYSYCFEEYLHTHQVRFSKVNALLIKRSVGMARGKSDKIDSRRIAAYGHEKQEKLVSQQKSDKELQRLQMLHSVRDKLIRQRAGLICSVKEYTNIGLTNKDVIIKCQLDLIKAIKKQVENLDNQIEAIISSQEVLKKNYNLLISMKGVGKVLALNTIIKTHNFTRFANGRKFACFCGTAPFEHTSGTSIRGRARVSHMADKHMKTLLDLSAKCAIRTDKELKEFYLKRVAAGKSKMSTINIVRNKIIYRMFSIIKRQTPFIENYLQVA
jgi:transposase